MWVMWEHLAILTTAQTKHCSFAPKPELKSDQLDPLVIGDEVKAVWIGETWNGKNDKCSKKN